MDELKELRALTEELNERNIKLTTSELVNMLLATIEIIGDNKNENKFSDGNF